MNTENTSNFKTGIDAYNQVKPDGDIDLIAEVRDILTRAGIIEPLSNAYDNDRFIIEAVGKVSTIQRYLLNRYWTKQLIASGKPTSEERYTLIPNGEISDWLKLFESKIIPFALDNNLPLVID